MKVPNDFAQKISLMDGNVYVSHELHEAYHHYLKVVTANVENLKMGRRPLKAYQIIQNSQLSFCNPGVVPEAKFIFDLSLIAVNYEKRRRHWYDYLTSALAIIGGTFTFVGMIESTLARAVSWNRY